MKRGNGVLIKILNFRFLYLCWKNLWMRKRFGKYLWFALSDWFLKVGQIHRKVKFISYFVYSSGTFFYLWYGDSGLGKGLQIVDNNKWLCWWAKSQRVNFLRLLIPFYKKRRHGRFLCMLIEIANFLTGSNFASQ